MYRLFLLLPLLLAACAPGSYDPELAAIDARAKADALSEQAAIIAQRTAEAEIASVRATEVEQAQRDNASATELAVIEARAAERREAVILHVTEQAVWSAEATATAAPIATATAYAAALPATQAAQQAIERQVRIDEALERRIKVSIWAIPTVVTLVLVFLAWRLGAYIDKKAEIMEYNSRIRESRLGTVSRLWDPELEDYLWLPLADAALTRRLGAHSDFPVVDAVEFSRGQVTATSAPGNGNGDNRKLAIDLVRDAIASGNEGGNLIPSYRRLHGWSGRKWSKAVSWLKMQKAVKTVDNVGTYITYENLADLLYALETEQPPAPQG